MTDINKIIDEANDGKTNKNTIINDKVDNFTEQKTKEQEEHERLKKIIGTLTKDEAKQYTKALIETVRKVDESLKFSEHHPDAPNHYIAGGITEDGKEVFNQIPLALYLEKVENMKPSPDLIMSLIDHYNNLNKLSKKVVDEFDTVREFIQDCLNDDNYTNDYTVNQLKYMEDKRAFYNVNPQFKTPEPIKINEDTGEPEVK